jgi:hypothetical protein
LAQALLLLLLLLTHDSNVLPLMLLQFQHQGQQPSPVATLQVVAVEADLQHAAGYCCCWMVRQSYWSLASSAEAVTAKVVSRIEAI